MKARKSLIVSIPLAILLALVPRLIIGCASQEKYNVMRVDPRSAYSASQTPGPQLASPPILGDNQGLPTPATSPSSELWVIERNPPQKAIGPVSSNSLNEQSNANDVRQRELQYQQQTGQTIPLGMPRTSPQAAQPKIPYNDILRYPSALAGSGATGLDSGALAGRAKQSSAGSSAPQDIYDSVLLPTAEGPAGLDQSQAATQPSQNSEATSGPVPVERDTDHNVLEKPGCGELIIQDHNGQQNIPVPLDHTDVTAQIQGYVASVHVTQRYRNPFSEKIEAVYVFPLPQDAAVNEFVMAIGDRRIRGIIRERAEAERIYHEARAQGYVASLLTQERPNIFTQSVSNIEPNKQIDIDITYFNTMNYVDGSYEFVFPMVVGPRFNPPGSTDGIGAVGRGQQGISGQKTEVQYLRPDERSGNDIALSVDLNAGVPIEALDSRNHKINVKKQSPGHVVVSLDPADSIPNKDFVLRYRVAGARLKSGMFVQRDDHGGYFTLMLYPPATLGELPRQPMEMVFTIDVSGSQSGAPLAQEKAATRYCLTHMGADDTFPPPRFGDTARTLFAAPMPAIGGNVQQALNWIDGFDATEGTMLVEGVHASLLFPHDESRLRLVAFLTDGFIGNEAEALREIHNCLGPARIFSFGVGSSTNRFLLDQMAKMGNGAAAYLGLNDDANQVMANYFQTISHPALTDISVDFGSMNACEVYPERIGDLFVGRPVVISGRFNGDVPKQVVVHGKVGGKAAEYIVPISAENVDSGPSHPLASVWARAKLADLGDRAVWEADNQLPVQMKQVALEYGLVSDYTAFVAVDSLTKTSGDHGVTVAVPVPVPDGVRYETTVQAGTARSPQD
jgi:Ca-activated chloride channel family protein